MSYPNLVSPLASSTTCFRSLPTSVPPLRRLDQSLRLNESEMPSFIPSSSSTRCQVLPEPSSKDITSISNKFFLVTPSGDNADPPNASASPVNRVVRIPIRYSKKRTFRNNNTSSTNCAALARTSAEPKVSHQVVTPDQDEPEHLEFDVSNFIKHNENHSSPVKAADLFLPSLVAENARTDQLLPKRRYMIES